MAGREEDALGRAVGEAGMRERRGRRGCGKIAWSCDYGADLIEIAGLALSLLLPS